MYIKEVSIDGFKSYAQRVTLSNFDPGFNAITGLNGSGKSNILDAICFVMGIKNLSAVRGGTRRRRAPRPTLRCAGRGAAWHRCYTARFPVAW
jgi:recombinational DNA repair ATPase RecF